MWWRLVFKEILSRKWGFLFSILAVAVAVGAWVMVESVTASLKVRVGGLKDKAEGLKQEADILKAQADGLNAQAEGMQRDTTRILAGMQQNLLIVPAAVPEEKYYRGDFGDESLPEWIVNALLDPNVVLLVDTRLPSQRGGKPAIQLLDAKSVDLARLPKYVKHYELRDLADHLTAELQANAFAQAGGLKMDVILTGQRREEGRKSKNPLVLPAQPGRAHVGSAVAARLKLKKGDQIEISGPGGMSASGSAGRQAVGAAKSFTVDRVEPEQAGPDDIRVFVSLADAQELLDKPGRINRVIALSCQCEGVTINKLAEVLDLYVRDWSGRYRARMLTATQPEGSGGPGGSGATGGLSASVSPQPEVAAGGIDPIGEPLAVRVTPMTRLATARESVRDQIEAQRQAIDAQRAATERQKDSVDNQWKSVEGLNGTIRGLAAVLMPLLGAVIALLIGGYFYFNVRERQQEIGVLLAVGYTPGPIILALLAKLALVSAAGGLLGVPGGIFLTRALAGLPSLQLPGVVEPWYLWPVALAGAVVLTLLAGIYPLLLAARVRAADILRNA